MTGHPQMVFSTRTYRYFLPSFDLPGRFEIGQTEIRAFPDGERYQRVLTGVSNRDVVLIGGTVSDSDTLELYDLAFAFVKYGARRLTMIIPYFGYSTMERAAKPGEVVTAKARARLFSSIPNAPSGNRVVLLDVHSEGLPHYFESELTPISLSARSTILSAIEKLGLEDFVIGCTDAGRAKWVQMIANELGVTASFVFKRRLSGTQTEVTAVAAQVSGKRVIIYDDMIRTGGSLLNAAQAYRNAGASEMFVVATHGLFPNDSARLLHSSGLFARILVSNSHPRAIDVSSDFIEILDVGGIFRDFLTGEEDFPNAPK